MKLISWDVGIYNLAYCLIEVFEDKTYKIIDWNLININNSNTSKTLYCSEKNINKTICKNRAKYTDKKDKSIGYCLKHIKGKSSENIKQIKKKPKKKHSILDLGKNLITILDKYPFLIEVDQVIIENQPVLKNPTMKSVQMILYTYFLIHGVAKNKIKDISFVSARNKLKIYDGPPIEVKIKGKYAKNKKLSIEYCKYMIGKLNQPKFVDLFLKNKKKDDLADSFLQGIWFLNKNNSI